MQYITYELDTGKIRNTATRPYDVAPSLPPNRGYIETSASSQTSYVDIKTKTVIPRPMNMVTLSPKTSFAGSIITLQGMPAAGTLHISEHLQENTLMFPVPKGDTQILFSTSGYYRIIIHSFPYLDTTLTCKPSSPTGTIPPLDPEFKGIHVPGSPAAIRTQALYKAEALEYLMQATPKQIETWAIRQLSDPASTAKCITFLVQWLLVLHQNREDFPPLKGVSSLFSTIPETD